MPNCPSIRGSCISFIASAIAGLATGSSGVCRRWHRGNDRGSALLMTLGILLLMMVIGLGFMFSAMVDRDVAHCQADGIQAKLNSDSGIQRGMAILQKAAVASSPVSFSPFQLPLFTPADPKLPKGYYCLKNQEIDVEIFNRTGKLDPNWFSLKPKEILATLVPAVVGQDQCWVNREQIFQSLGILDQIKQYEPDGDRFNQDFFPFSPAPMICKSDRITPDPAAGGANTFLDWQADWRDLTKITPDKICMRVPVEYLAYLDFSAANGVADVRFAADVPYFGASATPAGRDLGVHLPWFRALREARAADMASYYELVANVKDYLSPGDLPTHNLCPSLSLPDASLFTTFCRGFFASGELSNPAATGFFPYCGTKPVPNLAEISLEFDQASGLKSAKVELVDFYLEQHDPAISLNDLAVLLEVEWNGTCQQKAILGFANTPVGALNTSVSFEKLHSSGSMSATTAKVSRVRAYLVKVPGIGAKVGHNVTAKDIDRFSLMDACILDIPAAAQLTQTLYFDPMLVPDDGTKVLHLEARDPRNNTRWTYGNTGVWTIGFNGSMGMVNPDWWKSVPPAKDTIWSAEIPATVGDRFFHIDKEYEVLQAHVTSLALAPDLPAAAAYFTPVRSPAEASGRNVWMAGEITEDAVAKPANGVMAAAGAVTVDAITSTCIRPSTAYVRRGPPLSLWELGAINRAEPWRTIRLAGGRLDPDPAATPPVYPGDYAMGDWMLLDEVSLFTNNRSPAVENGKVNPNPELPGTPAMKLLFWALGRSADLSTPKAAYECLAPTIQLVNPATDLDAFSAVFTAAPIISRGELAVALAVLPDHWNPYETSPDAAGRLVNSLDRNQEELIGKAGNLLQTRYQYFEIRTTGRYYRGSETSTLSSVRTSHANIERDAYTGKLRIISCEHIND